MCARKHRPTRSSPGHSFSLSTMQAARGPPRPAPLWIVGPAGARMSSGAFQIFTVRSIPAVASSFPLCEKVTKWMRRWCPLNSAISLRVAMSQTRTTLSRPAEANVLPSGENAQKRTHRVWPLNGASSLPEPTSHSCTSLLAPAEASSLPSAVNATEWTGPVCTSIVVISLRGSTFRGSALTGESELAVSRFKGMRRRQDGQ